MSLKDKIKKTVKKAKVLSPSALLGDELEKTDLKDISVGASIQSGLEGDREGITSFKLNADKAIKGMSFGKIDPVGEAEANAKQLERMKLLRLDTPSVDKIRLQKQLAKKRSTGRSATVLTMSEGNNLG